MFLCMKTTAITVVAVTAAIHWAGERCTGMILSDGELIGLLFGNRQVAATDDMVAWLAKELGL